jgi:oligopeptide/dipeptide ABC transporter ATP-binding protein
MHELTMNIVGLRKTFPVGLKLVGGIRKSAERIVAIDSIELGVDQGETVGIVGESGCGKSTLGYAIMRLFPVDKGTIMYRGKEITNLSRKELKGYWRRVQMVFQDPHSSLNPRKTVGQALQDPLQTLKGNRNGRVLGMEEILNYVGLNSQMIKRYPHMLSGGQRQRIIIARALAMNPEFVILDEPVSALDVSIQAQIINLLMKLREDLNLTMILISHDLAVVKHICSKVAVMYAGRIIEVGPASAVLEAAAHPYTQGLIESIPIGVEGRHRKRKPVKGEPPDLRSLPKGCRFAARCPHARSVCSEVYPTTVEIAPNHFADCHLL